MFIIFFYYLNVLKKKSPWVYSKTVYFSLVFQYILSISSLGTICLIFSRTNCLRSHFVDGPLKSNVLKQYLDFLISGISI